MSKGKMAAKGVVALAYFHRYGWIATMVVLVTIMLKLAIYIIGISFILFSLWTLIGYKLKWRHIYCSLQDAYHTKMTPHSIHWSQIQKSDIFVSSVLFLILGLVFLIMSILCGPIPI